MKIKKCSFRDYAIELCTFLLSYLLETDRFNFVAFAINYGTWGLTWCILILLVQH